MTKKLRRQVPAMREHVGERERRKKRGLQLHWIPPCQVRGLRWDVWGGIEVEGL